MFCFGFFSKGFRRDCEASMDSFFKAAVCDLDKVLDDFELNAGEVLKEVEFNSHYKMNNVERILINVMYYDSLI